MVVRAAFSETERKVEEMSQLNLITPHWHCKLCGYPLPIGTRQPGFHQICPSCKTEYAWHAFGEYDLPNITSTRPKPSRVDGMLRDLRKGIDDMLGDGVLPGKPTLIDLAEAIMGSVNNAKHDPRIVPLETEDVSPHPVPPNPYGETKIDPVDIDVVKAMEEDEEVPPPCSAENSE